MKSQGCRILRYGRTDYHVSINSQQRQRIYCKFVNFCQQNDLFKFAIIKRNQYDSNLNYDNPPYLNPQKIFEQRDLQFIFKIYCMKKGDIFAMAEYFRLKQVYDPRFQTDLLDFGIQNLLLIGFYNGYKKYAQVNGQQIMRWTHFRQKHSLPDDLDNRSKCIWLRIAIRNDPQQKQINWFQRYLRRKINIVKSQRYVPQRNGNIIQFKKWQKSRQFVKNKITQKLQQTLLNNIHQNQEQNQLNCDSKSIISDVSKFTSKQSHIKQIKQQIKIPQPLDDQQQSQFFNSIQISKMQRQPQFVKKVMKYSQIGINKQYDNNNNFQQVQEEIGSAFQPQNYFYSQKPCYYSRQSYNSLRSQHRKKLILPTKKQARRNKRQDQMQQNQFDQNYDQIQDIGQMGENSDSD